MLCLLVFDSTHFPLHQPHVPAIFLSCYGCLCLILFSSISSSPTSICQLPVPSVFFYHALSACVWLYFFSISSPPTSNYRLPVPAFFCIMLCLFVFDSVIFHLLFFIFHLISCRLCLFDFDSISLYCLFSIHFSSVNFQSQQFFISLHPSAKM